MSHKGSSRGLRKAATGRMARFEWNVKEDKLVSGYTGNRAYTGNTRAPAAVSQAIHDAVKNAEMKAENSDVVVLVKDGKVTEEGMRRGIKLPSK
jgi:hypothetical protein